MVLRHLSHFFPNGLTKGNIKHPGSLLRWLLVQTDDEIERRQLYAKYLGNDETYSSESLGVSKQFSASLPDIVTSLSGLPGVSDEGSVDTSSLFYDDHLAKLMSQSLQPPHLVEDQEFVPGSAFPFCHYAKENEKNSGMD